GSAAGDEALRELRELIGHDAPLDHVNATLLRQLDDRAAGDAIKEAISDWRVNLAVPDEENVGAGAFRDAALPVQHHGIGIPFALGDVLGNGADHVKAGGLRARGCGFRIGPAVVCEVEPDTLQSLHWVEIARPLPGGDGDVD